MSSPLERPVQEPGEPAATPADHADEPLERPLRETRDHTVVLDPLPDSTRLMDPVPAAPDADRGTPAGRPAVQPLPPIRLAPAPPPPLSFPPPHADPAPAARPLPPQAPPARRRPPLGVLAGAAVALVLVAGVAVAGLRLGSGGSGGPGRTAGVRSPAAAAAAVPADQVRAAASTTQQRDGGITYVAANTLDGRPETAWNSDGQGAGAELTYTFATPVDLASITLLNGYQKVRTASNGSTVDLFALNQRVRTLRVVTDAGSTEWTLRDDRPPQTLSRAFGRTRTVRLQIVSTYPSDKYEDLAVSEVRFTARG